MPTPELFAIFPDLRGRAALVTGAGRAVGIGAAICRALADQGCNVFFTYYSGGVPRDPAEASEGDYAVTLLGDLRARGVRSECIDVDLGAARSAEMVLDRACEAFGALSILVNNAAQRDTGWIRKSRSGGIGCTLFCECTGHGIVVGWICKEIFGRSRRPDH